MKLRHPFADPPRMKPRKVKRESDAERAERAYVRARDRGCVAERAVNGAARIRTILACAGPIEVDHVRASGGLGMKSPTHRTNLVCLCAHHHRLKTEYGKTWRPILLAYLERVERTA